MLLQEYYGNLQQISEDILKKIMPYCNSIGKDSEIFIVKYKDADNFFTNNFDNISAFILRYGQNDKLAFYKEGNNISFFTKLSINRNNSWFTTTSYVKNVNELKESIEKNYKNYYEPKGISLEDFLNKINIQAIMTDKTKFEKREQRQKNRGEYLYPSYRHNKHDSEAKHNRKIHGSIKDTRSDFWYYDELKKRLKKYVESKFPSFDSIKDFYDADIKNILKAFKINGCVYRFSDYETNNFMKQNFKNANPLYIMATNKKGYLCYENNTNVDKMPRIIFFEIIVDIHGNVVVKNIYGYNNSYCKIGDLIPLQDYFIEKENKSSENKLINNNDDW